MHGATTEARGEISVNSATRVASLCLQLLAQGPYHTPKAEPIYIAHPRHSRASMVGVVAMGLVLVFFLVALLLENHA
jgi:hypothetical protein